MRYQSIDHALKIRARIQELLYIDTQIVDMICLASECPTPNMNASLLLSRIVWWHTPWPETGDDKIKTEINGELWLAKTSAEWWSEIRLTPKQIRTAAERLEEIGLIKRSVVKFNRQNTPCYRLGDRFLEFYERTETERAELTDESPCPSGRDETGSPCPDGQDPLPDQAERPARSGLSSNSKKVRESRKEDGSAAVGLSTLRNSGRPTRSEEPDELDQIVQELHGLIGKKSRTYKMSNKKVPDYSEFYDDVRDLDEFVGLEELPAYVNWWFKKRKESPEWKTVTPTMKWVVKGSYIAAYASERGKLSDYDDEQRDREDREKEFMELMELKERSGGA